MNTSRRQAGFTLLEVLVSLAILAIAMGALIHGAGQNAANQADLQERAFAHWVAMNRLSEVRLQETVPAIGRSEGTETLGKQDWRWTMEVQRTPDDDVLKIQIAVAPAGEEHTRAQLVGYTEVRR